MDVWSWLLSSQLVWGSPIDWRWYWKGLVNAWCPELFWDAVAYAVTDESAFVWCEGWWIICKSEVIPFSVPSHSSWSTFAESIWSFRGVTTLLQGLVVFADDGLSGSIPISGLPTRTFKWVNRRGFLLTVDVSSTWESCSWGWLWPSMWISLGYEACSQV